MRRFYTLLGVCISLFILSGCGKKYIGEEGLLTKAREEIPVANADTIDLVIAGKSKVNDEQLFWFVSGNEWQAHEYTPIQFTVAGKEEYKFVKTYVPIERGTDIVCLLWNDGYSFLVNNPDCANIQIEKQKGVFENVSVESIPFVYYYDEIPLSYRFLDVNGNDL